MTKIRCYEKHIERKIVFLFVFIPLFPFLSGCSAMRSKFDCNVDSGGRCVSMKQVNRMANQGAFQEKVSQKFERAKLAQLGNKVYGYPIEAFVGSPVRRGESIQQIWIGPYEDTEGNYHEPSYVYTVVKKGRWIGEPANVIQD